MGRFKLLRKPPKETWQELKKPAKKAESVPLWLFTVGYIACMGALILGIPTPTAQHPQSIPSEDLPVAIPIMIGGYFLILGLLKLFDHLRTKRERR